MERHSALWQCTIQCTYRYSAKLRGCISPRHSEIQKDIVRYTERQSDAVRHIEIQWDTVVSRYSGEVRGWYLTKICPTLSKHLPSLLLLFFSFRSRKNIGCETMRIAIVSNVACSSTHCDVIVCRGWAETKPKFQFLDQTFGFCRTTENNGITVKTSKKKVERLFSPHLFQKVITKSWL